jgi:hypothetical protein
MKRVVITAAIIAFVTVLNTGCYTTATVQTVPVDVTVYTVIPAYAPPPIVVTTGPGYYVQPGPKYIWIDGYWTWDYYRGAYTWVNGYWAKAPYYQAVWVPGYWEYRPAGYVWIDATWYRPGYLPYGYYDGRYDYYGRKVYYPQVVYGTGQRGYSYSYDHRSEYRGNEYSSYYDENNRGGTSGRTPTQNEGSSGRTPTTQPTTPTTQPATQPSQNQGTSGRTPTTQPTVQPTQNQGSSGRTTQPTQTQEPSGRNSSGGNTGGRR